MRISELKESCYGCCACADACPAGAVTLASDAEGFLYPQVDETLCARCGACEAACPALHPEQARRGAPAPACHAVVHKNLEVRFDSSAGGLFSALAAATYRRGGAVGGAVFNGDFTVAHALSRDKRDLARLRGAKPAQSCATGFYKAVRDALAEGAPVLACGTPCQIAALRLFLGDKSDERLLTLDFVCGGVCSPDAYRKYLGELEARAGAKVARVRPMNKELGWRSLTTKVVFADGQTLYDTKEESLFTRLRLATRAFSRPACYACPFRGLPRVADVTAADFWGAAKLAGPDFDQDLGASLVLLNTPRAEEAFAQVQDSVVSKAVPLERVLAEDAARFAPAEQPAGGRRLTGELLAARSLAELAARVLAPGAAADGWGARWRRARRALKMIRRVAGLSLPALLHVLRYNLFCQAVRGRGLLIPRRASVLQIHRRAKVTLNANLIFGRTHIKGSRLESRLVVESGAALTVNRETSIGYGADVEVLRGGELIFNGSATNIGLTVICGERISLGRGVQIGRNVTIRDNNGNHYLSLPGYKTSKPVEIGDHVWLCEGCTIMPGVKIGVGAVIGAKAVVFNNVPAHALVVGNPAEVVLEDVYWKY